MSVTKVKENVKLNENEQEFTVLLNGQKDLEEQLQQFKELCQAHDKHQRKRAKKRYYNLALMAKIERTTTHEELKRLLKNNARTFLLDVVTHKSHEVKSLAESITQVVKEQQFDEPKVKLTIGLALQITGDACRIGRIRNNCSIFLVRNDSMTLTTNMAYRYTCFKEIAFVINLQYYLPYLKISDEISIGPGVRAVIVKKLKTAIALRIEQDGILNSYDLIDLPNQYYNYDMNSSLVDIFSKDLETAEKLQADFIVLPHIRSLPFLKLLRHKLKSYSKFKLIGSIDLEYISSKMADLMGIIKHMDYLWLTNLFSNNQITNTILIQDVIPVAKCLKKPIIGSVPLERCNDFKLFENHEYLFKIDCMFIEKSGWCNKYPLVVKKLLPIKNYRLGVVDNTTAMHAILTNIQSIVHFVIRTISSIECQAIFLYTKCETAANALSRVEIYCPVYVILKIKEDMENNEDEINRLTELIKNLNLRRNLCPVLYSNEMNEFKYKPIDYGIEYARQCGCLETGDFIITLEVGKENGDEHVESIDEDVILMRAIFVPQPKIGEKFKC